MQDIVHLGGNPFVGRKVQVEESELDLEGHWRLWSLFERITWSLLLYRITLRFLYLIIPERYKDIYSQSAVIGIILFYPHKLLMPDRWKIFLPFCCYEVISFLRSGSSLDTGLYFKATVRSYFKIIFHRIFQILKRSSHIFFWTAGSCRSSWSKY